MTIKNLIHKLSAYPDQMEVLVRIDDGEFDMAPLEELEEVVVTFSEGRETEPPVGEHWPQEKCLVLGADSF